MANLVEHLLKQRGCLSFSGRTDRALGKYLILAELGYEVAQSNVAFILDRKESELFDDDEMWKRALVYWTR